MAGVDPLFHATVWVHERLGWCVITLAGVSAVVVAGKVVRAQLRFARLQDVSEPLPARLQNVLARAAAAELGCAIPRVLYVDLAAPIATTVFNRTVVLSSGFIASIDDAELELVMRHELAHVHHRDAVAGVLGHLAFAALLIPGFEPLERRLHARRERAANAAAASGREQPYLALMMRLARGHEVCERARLGLGAASRRPGDRWLAWLAPTAARSPAVALPLSHAVFRHDLPYLLSHHC